MKKQSATNEDFIRLWHNCEADTNKKAFAELEERTLTTLHKIQALHKDSAAIAYSGGKDSLVLQHLANRAGISKGVLGSPVSLEYTSFMSWLRQHKGADITILDTGQDLDFLRANPQYLFPSDSKVRAQWYKAVQHKAQEDYYDEEKLTALLLGRRVQDGNYTGAKGASGYVAKGRLRLNPIAYWTHTDIFYYLKTYKIPLPPIYDFARGWRCGTHAWNVRSRSGGLSCDNVMSEIMIIEPTIIREAADKLTIVSDFLRRYCSGSI